MMHPQTSEKGQDGLPVDNSQPGGFIGVFEAAERTACTIGSIALTLMAAVLGYGIISRYLFNRPFAGVYDIIQLLLVWVVFLSLSLTQKEEQHIRVEIILRRLSGRSRLYLEIASDVLGGAFCLLMTWQAALFAWSSVRTLEYWPGLLRVPIYPSKIALFVGVLLLCVRFFLGAAAGVRKLRQSPPG